VHPTIRGVQAIRFTQTRLELSELNGFPSERQKMGTTWEQTLPNSVQSRDARHRKRQDEPTTWRFCSYLVSRRPALIEIVSSNQASATKDSFLSVISMNPATIRIDKRVLPNESSMGVTAGQSSAHKRSSLSVWARVFREEAVLRSGQIGVSPASRKRLQIWTHYVSHATYLQSPKLSDRLLHSMV